MVIQYMEKWHFKSALSVGFFNKWCSDNWPFRKIKLDSYFTPFTKLNLIKINAPHIQNQSIRELE